MKYWSLAEVAKYIGVSRVTLWAMRKKDASFPVPVLIQSTQRFDVEAVKRWEKKRHAANQAENARRLSKLGR